MHAVAPMERWRLVSCADRAAVFGNEGELAVLAIENHFVVAHDGRCVERRALGRQSQWRGGGGKGNQGDARTSRTA